MEISGRTQSEVYVAALRKLESAPVISARGLRTQEIDEPVTLVVENPGLGFVSVEGRKLNHAISVLEGLSLIGQTSVPEIQTDRIKVFTQFQNGSVFRGSYGPRVEGGLDDIVDLLKRDPDSRQAVLTIYNSQRDLGRWNDKSISGDVPCTIGFQFRLRQRATAKPTLDMWALMRSNDAWRGLPYDMGQFTLLMFAMAQALDAYVGVYRHSTASLHLYEEHWIDAEAVSHTSYVPFFGVRFGDGKTDLPHIAERARRMLIGRPPLYLSPLETWCARQLRVE